MIKKYMKCNDGNLEWRNDSVYLIFSEAEQHKTEDPATVDVTLRLRGVVETVFRRRVAVEIYLTHLPNKDTLYIY